MGPFRTQVAVVGVSSDPSRRAMTVPSMDRSENPTRTFEDVVRAVVDESIMINRDSSTQRSLKNLVRSKIFWVASRCVRVANGGLGHFQWLW